MSQRALETGDVLADRYRIDATLGRGGMGAVYRGFDLGIRRPVAIKVLTPALRGHSTPNERMAREAFATARVAHQHCVTVLDCGSLDDGSMFLAMELLEGRDLAAVLSGGRIEQRRALRIAAQVLRGLAHAHDAGVIHRDLKPANIYLINDEGDPDFAKLLDFGIAKLVGDAREEAGAHTLTQEGLAIGSPVYMSPEQAIGNPLDARSDLYSLSVLLFEMLTGKPPFDDADKIAVLRMHLARPAPALTDIAPDLRPLPGLEALIGRGLAKDPDARVQSAREYLGAIAAIERHAPAPAPMPVPAQASEPAAGFAPTVPTPTATPVPDAPTTPVATPIPSPTPSSGPAQLVAPPVVPRSGQGRRAAIIGASILAACGILALAFSGGDSPVGGEPTAVAAPTEAKTPDTESETEPPKSESPKTEAEPAEDDAELLDPLAAEIAEIDRLRRARRLRAAQLKGRKLVRKHPDSASLHLAYGHVFFEKMWWSDGFEHYRRAIEIDPDLRDDPALIANSVRALSSRSKPWLAERFIRRHLRERATEALEQAARSRSRSLQRRAKRLLRQIKRQ